MGHPSLGAVAEGALAPPVLAGLAHDLRSRLTALGSFVHLLDEQLAAGRQDAAAQSYLAAIKANHELLVQLLDGLALLERPGPTGQAPVGEILAEAGAQLQEFLSRCQVVLKLPGVFPDRDYERRSLAAVTGQVLHACGRALGRAEGGAIDVEVSELEDRMIVQFVLGTGDGKGETVARTLESALSRDAGFGAVVLETALARLGGRLDVEGDARPRVALTLPVAAAGGAR